jgi:hypothetical protein
MWDGPTVPRRYYNGLCILYTCSARRISPLIEVRKGAGGSTTDYDCSLRHSYWQSGCPVRVCRAE